MPNYVAVNRFLWATDEALTARHLYNDFLHWLRSEDAAAALRNFRAGKLEGYKALCAKFGLEEIRAADLAAVLPADSK